MKLLITGLNNKIICTWHDNGRLIQASTQECEEHGPKLGDIYSARIKNLIPNINAAFVDIGHGDLCFLQLSEAEKNKYKREMELPVQIIKEGYMNKQPAVTDRISIPGRYLVLTACKTVNISNKIKNVIRRKELTQWLEEDSCECGFIVRTNAAGISKDMLQAEKEYLIGVYKEMLRKNEHECVFSCLFKAPCDYLCAVRDSYESEIEKIVTDIPAVYNNIVGYARNICPELADRTELYKDDSYSMSALYGIETGIEKALNRRVWLDSGAYLIFDVTEACTIIDVNTGKAIHGKGNSEKTFHKINLEAAQEIMLQLRLRNISGIIIVDFIDMKSEEHIAGLLSILRELAARDPLKTVVVDITKLGLVEITRKKSKKTLYEQLNAKRH